ncbi:MAG: hypothetical protein ACREUE_08010 [Panacagrimonas sp.]
MNSRRRFAPVAIASILFFSLPAVSAEPFAPYLDCAASRAHYAVLLRDSKYPDAADLAKVEQSVHSYLRIAVSLAGRDLQEEFRVAANKVQTAEEAVMKKDGANAYLAYAETTHKACAERVAAHQQELLEVMERYEAQRLKSK